MIPHTPSAEAAVVGACMLSNAARTEAVPLLSVEDFHDPKLAACWTAIVSLHSEGEASDPVTMLDLLRNAGREVELEELVEVQAATPSTSNVASYARIVATDAVARRLMELGSRIANQAQEPGRDPLADAETYAGELANLDTPLVGEPTDVHDFVDWLESDVDDAAPWVVPGMLRRRDRMILVASEGIGKAVFCRTLAVCAAYGVRPFFGSVRQRPVPVLLCDFENSHEAIVETGRRLQNLCAKTTGQRRPEASLRLWHREAGIDIRRRRDRAQLEALLRSHRPELVVVGPLYKVFRRQGREDHEQVAEEVTEILDDLRTRYDHALVIEHHAPKGPSAVRDLIPFGSSVWQRWPEMGYTLKPSDNPHSFGLGRFRGDRVHRDWPQTLTRGAEHEWPWMGKWKTDQRGYAA